jgi:hypothetical protein
MKKRYWLLYFSILAAILAGCLEMPLPVSATPTDAPLPVSTSTRQPVSTETRTWQTAKVLPEVLSVRNSAGGIVIDWLRADQFVTVIECKDNWCQISTNVLTGYVFRGCLSGNTDLGCSAK